MISVSPDLRSGSDLGISGSRDLVDLRDLGFGVIRESPGFGFGRIWIFLYILDIPHYPLVWPSGHMRAIRHGPRMGPGDPPEGPQKDPKMAYFGPHLDPF